MHVIHVRTCSMIHITDFQYKLVVARVFLYQEGTYNKTAT